MTPTALADRIAALDWSGVSLQHRLAVTAACETLRKQGSAAEMERAPVLANAVIPCPNPVGCNWPACAQSCQWRPGRSASVVPFPALRGPSAELLRGAAYTPGKRVTLCNLMDGTPVASALLARAERWDWIVETVCELCSCLPETVSAVDDIVTVDGLPVFSC